MLQRVLRWALVICVGAVIAVEAVGQTSSQTQPVAPDITGWNHVGLLSDGQKIIVSVGPGFPIHCRFQGTTDHSLYCEKVNLSRSFEMREIARDDVAWLRIDNLAHERNTVVPTCAGAGAVPGGTSFQVPSVCAFKVAVASISGAIGAGIGDLASLSIGDLSPGRMIYSRPQRSTAAHLHWPIGRRPAVPIEPAQTQ
jgi:hypothetical protein